MTNGRKAHSRISRSYYIKSTQENMSTRVEVEEKLKRTASSTFQLDEVSKSSCSQFVKCNPRAVVLCSSMHPVTLEATITQLDTKLHLEQSQIKRWSAEPESWN